MLFLKIPLKNLTNPFGGGDEVKLTSVFYSRFTDKESALGVVILLLRVLQADSLIFYSSVCLLWSIDNLLQDAIVVVDA